MDTPPTALDLANELDAIKTDLFKLAYQGTRAKALQIEAAEAIDAAMNLLSTLIMLEPRV